MNWLRGIAVLAAVLLPGGTLILAAAYLWRRIKHRPKP
jgi:hypothetical protein